VHVFPFSAISEGTFCRARLRSSKSGWRHRSDRNDPKGQGTSLAGAAQPDRKSKRQQGGIDGKHTHATFEPINSPIRPPCSTHALATAHAGTWPSPSCFLPGDKTLREAGNPQGGAAARGPRKFQDASSPHSPARRLAQSTPRARHRAAGSSKDGATQGGEHAQALVPLHAGRMGSYQPMLKRGTVSSVIHTSPARTFLRFVQIFDRKIYFLIFPFYSTKYSFHRVFFMLFEERHHGFRVSAPRRLSPRLPNSQPTAMAKFLLVLLLVAMITVVQVSCFASLPVASSRRTSLGVGGMNSRAQNSRLRPAHSVSLSLAGVQTAQRDWSLQTVVSVVSKPFAIASWTRIASLVCASIVQAALMASFFVAVPSTAHASLSLGQSTEFVAPQEQSDALDKPAAAAKRVAFVEDLCLSGLKVVTVVSATAFVGTSYCAVSTSRKRKQR